MIELTLPRNLLVQYCAPDNLGLVATLGGCFALALVFGAIMSFTSEQTLLGFLEFGFAFLARGVSENFNESKTIAWSIYSVLFTSLIVVLIAMLQQQAGLIIYHVFVSSNFVFLGAIAVVELASFALIWIALTTVMTRIDSISLILFPSTVPVELRSQIQCVSHIRL